MLFKLNFGLDGLVGSYEGNKSASLTGPYICIWFNKLICIKRHFKVHVNARISRFGKPNCHYGVLERRPHVMIMSVNLWTILPKSSAYKQVISSTAMCRKIELSFPYRGYLKSPQTRFAVTFSTHFIWHLIRGEFATFSLPRWQIPAPMSVTQ